MGARTPQTPGSRTPEQERAAKRRHREALLLGAATVVVAIVIAFVLGGIAALNIIRFVIAALVIVLSFASRAVRNRRIHSKEEIPVAPSQERDDALWQREQERYAAKQRGSD